MTDTESLTGTSNNVGENLKLDFILRFVHVDVS